MLNPLRFLQTFLSVLRAVSLVLLLIFGVFIGLAAVVFFADGGLQLPNSAKSFGESLYFSAVTALTIGYGDIVPHTFLGRTASLLLGLLGITLTGIIAGAAVRALQLQMEEERMEKSGKP
jgi:voltage-gated potassium channel